MCLTGRKCKTFSFSPKQKNVFLPLSPKFFTVHIVIDGGNTRIKVAQFQDEKLQNVEIFANQEALNIFLKKCLLAQAIIVSNVGSWTFEALNAFQGRLIYLNKETKVPFQSFYASPQTLGNDRRALAAAALYEFPQQNCLVFDAGTCLTVDFIDTKGAYHGGAISPGLSMRFEALHSFTQNLPKINWRENALPALIGDSTANSIRSGVVRGYLAEIEGIIEQYKEEFDDLRIVFCGGDTSLLRPWLKNDIFAPSNFLIKGLEYILRYNLEGFKKS
ncbi:MAG: pantothenate kinase [Bacteroidetes bacterium]|nr:MAG: pantothenate kinase [Bacteroidota bacterium]